MIQPSLPLSGAKGERCILAVSAHPDDVEFTSGGSIARWAAEGWTVHLVVCTDGGKGSLDPRVDPQVLAVRRREEQRAAAETLGVAEVTFLDHPDGTLAMRCEPVRPELTAELTRLIRRVRPNRLLCWDPWRRYQLHPDHRAAGLATLDAVLAAGNPHYFPEQLAEGGEAHQVPEVYLFGAEEPDTWVDITETFERKMVAIAAHHSQVARLPDLVEGMRRCNRDYGQQCGRVDADSSESGRIDTGCTYAEAFKVLHPFCDT